METQTVVALVVVISLSYAPLIWRNFVNNWKLRSIPTVGSSGYVTSYFAGLRFLLHAQEMVQDGYNKHHGSVFKVPTLKSWMIFVSGRHHISEIRSARDDLLSLTEAIKESGNTDITIGPEHLEDPFHVEAVRGPLTRNIGSRLADVQDEIGLAFDDYIPVKGNEWVTVTAYSTMMDIVCRATNRMLVGTPLCRDPDWIDLNKKFTIAVVATSSVLKMFPRSLRRYIAPLLRPIPRGIQRGAKHLEPLIKERLKQEEEHGEDWPERPNDIISWLFEATEGRQRKMRDLTNAVLLVNFTSIHTTTIALTYVLFDLAARPEYVKPLREEVEAVIKEQDWSKDAISKLWKLDSFIKEVMRLSNPTLGAMSRKVMKDFTFSDGTTIPAGNTVYVPYSVHTDPGNYTDPEVFDGFRFEKMRQQEGEGLKHQIITLGLDYVLFGNGRHACPGRFFAANELKVMLAHVLLNYDVKIPDGRSRPKNWCFGENIFPDPTAQVMFRKRSEV